MANTPVQRSGSGPAVLVMGTSQTGTTANTAPADRGDSVGPGAIKLVTTVGATPTCTYAVEGSIDGTNFFAIPYSLPATPETLSVATFDITSATTTWVYLPAGYPWRYLRVTRSANTNVTTTTTAYLY